ncbi:Uncharacterised protein [Clostridium putrefaciens]|uniref:Uncharacterized protein n=1 Tax=Clostridium putrefaciens TaxID=99675 RepID=A0A381J6G0_9CLOT|nr:hypothetical protein [Clostridium putrefaciens]SUY46874.1 Uncharacterised protein [Clostridium putrefaciens]
MAYLFQNNEDGCKKEIKEEVVKNKEKQKLDDYEEIEIVSFLDYKTSNQSMIKTSNDYVMLEAIMKQLMI